MSPLPLPDEHYFATVGLTREQSVAIADLLQLLQPRLHFPWKLVTHDRAQVVFVTAALAEPERSRLHHDQVLVIASTEKVHAKAGEFGLDLPFRVAPVLELMHEIEGNIRNRSREVFRAGRPGDDLLALLRQWLHGRHAGTWHQTRLGNGDPLWLHPERLQIAMTQAARDRLGQPASGWSMPLPTTEQPPADARVESLVPFAFALATAPMASRPDWMFEDRTEVSLGSWPDLGQLGGQHWQVQAAALLSHQYLSIADVAHRVGRSVHDVAGFLSACDLFGHVLHRAPVAQLADHRPGQTRPANAGPATPEPALDEAAGLRSLFRAIRNRLLGNP